MPFTAINVRRELSLQGDDSAPRTGLLVTPKTTRLKSSLPARNSTIKSTRGQAIMQIGMRQIGALHAQQQQQNNEDGTRGTDAGAARSHYLGLPDIPSIRPKDQEFEDCGLYIQSLANLGQQFGMVRIKPPRGSLPKYNLSSEQFVLRTRRQTINDANTTAKLKRDFLAAFLKFYDQNIADVETLKSPIINGKLVDLYSLHRAVQLKGGFPEVSKNKQWGQVAREMGLAFIGHTVMFRSLYQRLLLPFDEFLYSHGVTLSASPKMVRIYVIPEGTTPAQGEVVLSGGIAVSTDCSSVSTAGNVENSAHCYRRRTEESLIVHSQPQPEEVEQLYELKTYSLKQFSARAAKFAQTYFKGPQSANDIEKEFWRLINEPKECIEVEQGTSFVSDSCTPTSFCSWASHLVAYTTNSVMHWMSENPRGFCDPYINVDMLFTCDNWHLTDYGTHEVHFHHVGSCKTYYSTSPKDYELVKSLFPNGFGNQINCLEKMRLNNVEIHATDLNSGEILVLFPRSFVCSFSHGFNLIDTTYVPLGYQWYSEAEECAKVFASQNIEPPLSFDKLMFKCLDKLDLFTAFSLSKSMRETYFEKEMQVQLRLAESAAEVVQTESAEGVICENDSVWRWLSWLEEIGTGKILDPLSFFETFDKDVKYRLHVRFPSLSRDSADEVTKQAIENYIKAADVLNSVVLTLYCPPDQLDRLKVGADIGILEKSAFQDVAAFGQRMTKLLHDSNRVRTRLLGVTMTDGKVTTPVLTACDILEDSFSEGYCWNAELEKQLLTLMSQYSLYCEQAEKVTKFAQTELTPTTSPPDFHKLLACLNEARSNIPFVESPQGQDVLDAINVLSELENFLKLNDIHYLRYHTVSTLYKAYKSYPTLSMSKLFDDLSVSISMADAFGALVDFFTETAYTTVNLLQTVGVMLELSRVSLVAPAVLQALRSLQHRLLMSSVNYGPLESRFKLSEFGSKYLNTRETAPAVNFCLTWIQSWPAQVEDLVAQAEDAILKKRDVHTLTFDWWKVLALCRQLYQMSVIPDNYLVYQKLEELLLALEVQSR